MIRNQSNRNHAKKGSLKIFLCEICDKECNSKVEIKKLSQEHLPELSFNKCDFKTPSSADLNEHKQNDHKPTKFVCDSYDFDTVHISQLQKHKRIEHTKSILFCDGCSYKASFESDLQRHKEGMYGKEIACDQCEIKYTSREDFNTHLYSKHGNYNSTSYFSSRKRNEFSGGNDDEERTHKPAKKVSENTNKSKEHKNKTDDYDETSPTRVFKCEQTCSIRQNNFLSKDELDLHMRFFHENTPEQSQQ